MHALFHHDPIGWLDLAALGLGALIAPLVLLLARPCFRGGWRSQAEFATVKALDIEP